MGNYEDWDGSERKLKGTCHKCNSDSFYMVGGKDEKDRIQVFWFCKKCGYKQGIIDHDYKLTKQDIAVMKARMKEIEEQKKSKSVFDNESGYATPTRYAVVDPSRIRNDK